MSSDKQPKKSKVIKKLDDFLEEKIQRENLEDIVSDRFASYSKYIIQDRALPDARDGLKPVQRRILYAMQQMGMNYNKPFKKSARIAGEVMGKYHPHGDSSIYDAMVRLSQYWKMNIQLIDMHGNNGSIDGDSAAAMRYTEARLSKAAEYLLKDIDKKTVPFIPNFDDEEMEPTVLPAKFPNLLVNGAMGISAGYATKIPPHNLNEVVEATIALIDNKDLTIKDISKIILGPDFPTGGIVQGRDGILEAIETGAGKVVIRAKTEIEQLGKMLERIIVHEIPFEVNKADLVKNIDALRIDKKIEDILEVRDESDKEGLRISIDLKQGADSNVILNYLLKNTELQVNFNYNMVTILNNRPHQIGVIPILEAYINHQKEIITNRSNYELERANKRQHIVDGLIKMVSVVDEVIRIIRASEDKKSSRENIMKAFGFTEIQAEAIVTLQLYRLSNTDIVALHKEHSELEALITGLNKILTSEKVLLKVIKDELKETAKELGTPRKSEIEKEIETIKIDELALISDEAVYVGITKEGYVKRANSRSYTTTSEVGLKNDDSLIFENEIRTLDTLLMFTSKGRYIYLPVYKIEEQRWRDLGIYINNIVPIDSDEKIISVYAISSFDTEQHVLLATKDGNMKQTALKEFDVTRYNRAMRAMKLSAKDELASTDIGQKQNIVSSSKSGYILRFAIDELPTYGLQAGGVKSMTIAKGDSLTNAIYAKDSDNLILFTTRGHVINDAVDELPIYGRGRRGILAIEKLKSNPHELVSIDRLSKEQMTANVEVRLIFEKGGIVATAADLKYNNNKYGKNMDSKGNLGVGEKIIIKRIIEDDELMVAKTIQKVSQAISKETKNIPKKEEKVNLVKDFEPLKPAKKEKDVVLSRLDLFEDE